MKQSESIILTELYKIASTFICINADAILYPKDTVPQFLWILPQPRWKPLLGQGYHTHKHTYTPLNSTFGNMTISH